jgi:hypothetical protein
VVFTIVILSEAKDLVACHWHEIPSATLRAGLRFSADQIRATQDDREENAHDADPLLVSVGRDTPQHCSVLSRAKVSAEQNNTCVPA